MPGYIPIQCSEQPGTRAGTVINHIQFVIPSLGRKFCLEFIPSKTQTALRRIMKIVDMESAGVDEDEIVAAMEKLASQAKKAYSAGMTNEEIAAFKEENGWQTVDEVLDEVYGDMSDEERDILGGFTLEKHTCELDNSDYTRYNDKGEQDSDLQKDTDMTTAIRAEINRSTTPVTTTDGRYTVNPLVGTAHPVDEIPQDIQACMACFIIMRDGITVTPGEAIPAGMEHIAEYEYQAAEKTAYEVAEILGMPADLVEFFDPAAETRKVA